METLANIIILGGLVFCLLFFISRQFQDDFDPDDSSYVDYDKED